MKGFLWYNKIEGGSTKSRLAGEYPNLYFRSETFRDAILKAVFTSECKAFIMSRLGSESTKYILLRHMMLGLEMQLCERGQIFVEGLHASEVNLPSGFIALYDESSEQQLRPRYESRRNPSPREDMVLAHISWLRPFATHSWTAIKRSREQRRNAHSLENYVRSLENKLAAQHQAWKNERVLLAQLEIQEKEIDLVNSEQISDGFETELMIQQEINNELKFNELQRKLARKQEDIKVAEHQFKRSEQRVQELEVTLAEEQNAHEQTKRSLKLKSEKVHELEINLASTPKALEEKENELIRVRQIPAVFEDKLVTEQETTKEVEKHHEGTVDKSNELQRKLACEQKAKEETEKRLEICQEKSKELETTLAATQKLVKKKQEPENECEWTLNREEIQITEEKLGSGTFGTVYKGMFRGTQVAVKQVSVKPKITEYNIGNFRREMKIASRCRHPCMLQFIGATSDDQSPLLLTELLDTSLKMVLLDRALDLVEIITIARDVAKGLNYLHLTRPHPIVHRDISSGSVLLWKHGQSWRGKISDYGNAVLMNYAKTGSGGAILYLAPEMNNKRFSPKCIRVYWKKSNTVMPRAFSDDEASCLMA
ncbi:dual specificity protein kinase shkB-like [Actinia tenebrosa]|uniref:Dual specificity protein kinase shkB-like n=1 Tax=Actinia tenebrosa TaxID=6105 RepID=A0A6P8ITJ3_ACTTE|nr:dual specificity protein kinase shkB-like [Actinia tenebrosa]